MHSSGSASHVKAMQSQKNEKKQKLFFACLHAHYKNCSNIPDILPCNNQDSAVLYAKTKVAVAVITVDGAWTVSCGRGLGCETAVRPYTLMTHVHQPPWYM